MKKIKKGSSLISVVIIFALLVIVSTTLMIATISGYKLRIKNNKRVENLYSAESGIEKAYADTANLIDETVNKGNEEVKKYNEILKIAIEKERLNLEEYLKDDKAQKQEWKGTYVKRDGALDEEAIYNSRNEVFKNFYKEYIKEKIKETVEQQAGVKLIDKNDSEVEKDAIHFAADKLNLDIRSSFLSKGIDRIVRTTFNIETPNYNATKTYKVAKIPVKNVWDKALTIGKDLKNDSTVTIDGDVYVFGNGDNTENKGVILNANSQLTLMKNLTTIKDINLLGKNSKLNFKGDSKTEEDMGRIVTGSLAINKDCKGSEINIEKGRVYANNDLVLNGQNSKISIDYFYGINDIGKDSSDTKREDLKNSSCIIVNSDDIGKGSEITIKEEAVLMGTAYIEVEPVYQTGESVSIKGNYRAYGEGLHNKDYEKGKYLEENVLFDYRKPLHLVSTFKNLESLTVSDKENYFYGYVNENGYEIINKGSSVNLPDYNNKKTISIGGIFQGDQFKKGNYKGISSEVINKINRLKETYMTSINELGSNKINTINDKVNKKIEDEIDFSKIKNIKDEKDNNGEKEIIYLNNNENISYTLSLGTLKKARGIIITKGDVYIDGDIELFRGTIISGGNVVFQGAGSKKIIHDKNYLKRVIASNYSLFKDIFIGNNEKLGEVIKLGEDESGYNEEFIRRELVKTSNWKIIK